MTRQRDWSAGTRLRVGAGSAIIDLAGNVGLILCAFSYAGQVFLAVTADASAFPDPDVLMAGMEREWHALIGRVAPNSSNVASPAAQAAERR